MVTSMEYSCQENTSYIYFITGAVPLSASVLDISTEEPVLFSLNCSASEATVNDCTHSVMGVCTGSSNAALRCLGNPLYRYFSIYCQ